MTQKVGLFGGTFDPVHNGHLRLAETAALEYDLKKILFIPAAVPPHKQPSKLTAFQHRAEMLKIALEGRNGFDISLVEATLPLPSYTIDTLRHLKGTLTDDTELYFLIGIDAFLEICTWKCYDEILREVSFIVSERESAHAQRKLDIAHVLNYVQDDHLWKSKDGKKEIHFLQNTPLLISSSDIREAVRTGKSFGELLPAAVMAYILQHGLYSQEKTCE